MRGLVKTIEALGSVPTYTSIADVENRHGNLLKQHSYQNNPVTTNRQSEAQIKSSTTEGKLYFIALQTLDRLEIQFVPKINKSRNANYANIQVIGRNTPRYQYLSGESTLNLELDFYAQQEDRRDVIDKCNWLEHLTFNDGYITPPQKIKLVFGDMYKDEVWVVKRVDVSYENFHKGFGFLPQQAYVNLTLALDPESSLTWEDVRTDGGNNNLGVSRG